MWSSVVVSGNPRPGSRTLKLATAVGEALSAEPPLVIDVADLIPGLLTPGDPATAAALTAIQGAKLLVVATPTYKGSYTGVLKVLLDNLKGDSLTGITAVPVVTAGIQPQADGAAGFLRHLLGELSATVATGLTAVEAQLGDIDALATEYAKSADDVPR